MNENQKLVDEYLCYKKESGLRRSTLNSFKSKLNKILFYLDEHDIEIRELSVKQAQAYQGWLKERSTKKNKPYAVNTIATIITYAYMFYDYLKQKNHVLTNPFKDIRKIKMDKMIPKSLLKEKQMNLLLDELSRFDEVQGFYQRIERYKLHVLAELLYATGMRIGEVGYLKATDIDLERGTVQVKDSKTKQIKVCILNDYAKQVLSRYMKNMRRWIFFSNNYANGSLFGASGERLSVVLNALLKEVCATLKLPRQTCHSFRHALGYHLLRAGCDIRYIQTFLGHRRLTSTQVYTKVDKEDLRKVLDQYHPRTFKRITHHDAYAV